MPRKKASPDPDSGAWRVILEDMRAQFGVLGDALASGLREIRGELSEFRQETQARFEVLEAVVRQNSTDIRHVASGVEKLEHIEERVTALEQRRG